MFWNLFLKNDSLISPKVEMHNFIVGTADKRPSIAGSMIRCQHAAG